MHYIGSDDTFLPQAHQPQIGSARVKRLEPPADAQRGLGRVQVLTRVADESIEVSIAGFHVYIEIVDYIVLGADDGRSSELAFDMAPPGSV
jgi:hypothetical protein